MKDIFRHKNPPSSKNSRKRRVQMFNSLNSADVSCRVAGKQLPKVTMKFTTPITQQAVSVPRANPQRQAKAVLLH